MTASSTSLILQLPVELIIAIAGAIPSPIDAMNYASAIRFTELLGKIMKQAPSLQYYVAVTKSASQYELARWLPIPDTIEAVSYVLEGVKNHHTLTHIGISGHNIGSNLIQPICSALKANQKLKHVNLSYNRLGDDEVIELCKVLETHQGIDTLNMQYNMVSDEGAVALADVLKTNKSLRHIDLFFNHIGDRGAIALAESMHDQPKLYKVNLRCNMLGYQGNRAIRMIEDQLAVRT